MIKNIHSLIIIHRKIDFLKKLPVSLEESPDDDDDDEEEKSILKFQFHVNLLIINKHKLMTPLNS